jgi:hypothetical protein
MVREVILIPWRPSAPDRVAAFYKTWTEQWERVDLPIYLGDSGHDKFHRAASRNAAARDAGRWDVALFADADVMLFRENIKEALRLAYQFDRVVFPHDRYQSLRKDGRPFQTSTAPTNGGALAISRAAWERVQGYDERFAGWGYEDAALRLSTETLLGAPVRLPGYMREVFHVKTRNRSDEERALYERYKRAVGNEDAMLALVNEDPLR